MKIGESIDKTVDVTFADQDSDSIYTTNEPLIVKHAKYCYENYPTIVNNIPKEPNSYNNTPEDFARVDNMLSHSQRTIGESSNLAQICLTYTYNFEDRKYYEYVCILSVLAQAAIDSAKRRFDVDISGEIKRIKNDIGISTHGYPEFWAGIRPGFNKDNINLDLKCPMNELFHLKNPRAKHMSFIPTEEFIEYYPIDDNLKIGKKVAELMSKYSLDMHNARFEGVDEDVYLVLRADFEDIIAHMRQLKLSKKYLSVMSWLLRNTFAYNETEHKLDYTTHVRIKKYRSLLFKVLYESNRESFIKCFKIGNSEKFEQKE